MNNKLTCIVLIVFATNLFGFSIPSNEVQVILLAGQSNMAGAGNYDELDESVKARIKKVSNRVWVSQSNTEQKPLSYYNNKPSEKYNFTKRFGPELFIGLTLAEKYPNQEFLLIKEAKGGTSLYGAWNPEWTSEKAKEIEKGEVKQSWNLCEIHIESIKKNLALLTEKGKRYKIIGMAWMQGENDAILEVAANSYTSNLKKLITKYRAEFNVMDMPFIAGQINSHYGIKGCSDLVRKAIVEVSNSDKNVETIRTVRDSPYNDYPKHSDNVHYNTEGQTRLGTAFAKRLINFL
ncbi:sialate O-acetylesterase [Tamlana sp. 2_MG-2023]|uniref:sialate O-acetylesterase n=1 Tax=unclassified Tamlana TaxID=2614803 RepID=UPI0026E3DC82|nr:MULTISPECIES: sialate O-acetylesterase [unclassified Tamlana]MDO6760964.1 sialate O-acetylesterase [Tamlana sp. 2_MG-2023]MDO6791220.1 sialate O-acetylesterase [Tamlana sp. 1_MG-2023]